MKKITTILGLVFISSTTVLAKIPDCINQGEISGHYVLNMRTEGKSANDIMNFIAGTTADPIWPTDDGMVMTTGLVNNKGEYIALTAIVKPNMNRFPKGTTLEQTREAVEKQLTKMLKIPGVTVECVFYGD